MRPANARELFTKYQSGTCSPEEQAVVERWLTFGEATPLDLSEPELDQDLAEIRHRVLGVKTRVKLWPRIVTVAAAVTAITLGVWSYYVSSPPQGEAGLFANDVLPGKHTATLTLADGRVIHLSEAKTGVIIDASHLKYSDGTALVADTLSLENEDKAQLLTATTPRGGTYQVVLPDGTRVWLNAASSIRFPARFSAKQRRVVAEGEAYFEVSKDPDRPFSVESRGQRVEVLGTHFNLNSYPDEEAIETTLAEGSVQVSATQGVSSLSALKATVVKLSPGQQSLIRGEDVSVRIANVAEVLDWKNGEFIFKNDDFESAMRRIARWYDVEIVYQNTKPITLEPRGWVSRNSKLSSVLNMIQSTKEVHFKIEGRKIIVTN